MRAKWASPGKRKKSAATRAKMAEAQQARWEQTMVVKAPILY
jgi:hypothetical protein